MYIYIHFFCSSVRCPYIFFNSTRKIYIYMYLYEIRFQLVEFNTCCKKVKILIDFVILVTKYYYSQ